MARFLPEAQGKPIMMDWQSRDGDRNADPDWQADWRRGHEIGLLIIGGLAWLIARGLKMRRLDDCLPSRMTWKPERMPQSAPIAPLLCSPELPPKPHGFAGRISTPLRTTPWPFREYMSGGPSGPRSFDQRRRPVWMAVRCREI